MSKNNGLSRASIQILVSRVQDWAKERIKDTRNKREQEVRATHSAYRSHPNCFNTHYNDPAIGIPLDAKLVSAFAKEGVVISVEFVCAEEGATRVRGLIPNNSPTLAKLRKAHNIPAPYATFPTYDTTNVSHSFESSRVEPIYCLKSDQQHVLDMITVIENAVLAGDGVAVACELNDMMEAIK